MPAVISYTNDRAPDRHPSPKKAMRPSPRAAHTRAAGDGSDRTPARGAVLAAGSQGGYRVAMADERDATPSQWNGLQWVSLGLVVVSWVLLASVYARLPDPVPTHWNVSGRADGFTPKPWGALLSPTLLTVVYLVTSVNLYRTRARDGHAESRVGSGAYQFGLVTVFFLFTSLHLYPVVTTSPRQPLGVVLGALLITFGAVAARLPRNGMLGIRTPWTLRSADVWRRTHAFGGKLWMLAGVVTLAQALVDAPRPVVMVTLAATIVVTLGYSWWIGRAPGAPP